MATGDPGAVARWLNALGPQLRARFDLADDLGELFDRSKLIQGLNDAAQVQGHVLVDQHVAKSRQAFQLIDQWKRKRASEARFRTASV